MTAASAEGRLRVMLTPWRNMLTPILAVALPALAGTSMAGGVAAAAAESPSGPPVNSSLPLLKGSVADGKKLKVARGAWTGAKTIAYAYTWQRCSAGGDQCAAIANAEGVSSYRLTSEDVGHTLRARVTATNGQGSSSATSSFSSEILAVGPHRRKVPTVSGTAEDGQALTAVNGTWKGTQPMTFTYQWQSCNRGTCSTLDGATQPTYRAATPELGEKLRVIVTAKNGAGSTSAASKTSPKIAPGPPVDLTVPSVSGTVLVGQTVSAEVGSWGGTGPLSYSYQWRTCNLLAQCSDVPGATESTYTVSPADVASSVEVVVSAANSLGSGTATSEPTSAVSAVLPSNTGLPSVSGLLQDGSSLLAGVGSWSGTEPLSFNYQWELCDAAGGACKEISGAIGSTLGLLAADVGSTLRVIVSASNSAGSTSAASAPTSVVSALLPSNTALPGISGLLQTGQLLSALKGTWSGTEPIAYSYQWQLCSVLGGSCGNVSKATEPTFKLALADVGLTLRVIVTATNSGGSTSATSAVTGLISGLL